LQGNNLATRLRAACDIGADKRVHGLSRLIEYRFNLPVLPVWDDSAFSGLTVRSGDGRLLCINKALYDGDVFALRTSVAHELCHALFDDDEELAEARVDQRRVFDDRIGEVDPVEQRATAFAAEFLAPKASVVERFNSSARDKRSLLQIAAYFGVSSAVAFRQLTNGDPGGDYSYLQRSTGAVGDVRSLTTKSQYRYWVRKEMTLGEIVLGDLAIGDLRKNLVSIYAAQLFRLRLITQDRLMSVLGWPDCSVDQVMAQVSKHPEHFVPT
jgi:hypothetical protein